MKSALSLLVAAEIGCKASETFIIEEVSVLSRAKLEHLLQNALRNLPLGRFSLLEHHRILSCLK